MYLVLCGIEHKSEHLEEQANTPLESRQGYIRGTKQGAEQKRDMLLPAIEYS
jgi:hypothetical protein